MKLQKSIFNTYNYIFTIYNQENYELNLKIHRFLGLNSYAVMVVPWAVPQETHDVIMT